MKILAILALGAASLQAADPPWSWTGSFGKNDVALLLLGDVNVEQRADPAGAMVHVRETLKRADWPSKGSRCGRSGRNACCYPGQRPQPAFDTPSHPRGALVLVMRKQRVLGHFKDLK